MDREHFRSGGVDGAGSSGSRRGNNLVNRTGRTRFQGRFTTVFFETVGRVEQTSDACFRRGFLMQTVPGQWKQLGPTLNANLEQGIQSPDR